MYTASLSEGIQPIVIYWWPTILDNPPPSSKHLERGSWSEPMALCLVWLGDRDSIQPAPNITEPIQAD